MDEMLIKFLIVKIGIAWIILKIQNFVQYTSGLIQRITIKLKILSLTINNLFSIQ